MVAVAKKTNAVKKKLVKKPVKKVARKSSNTVKKLKEEVAPEFLVVSVPQAVKEGASFKLLHVAPDFNSAEKFVDGLNGNASRMICIMEKKKFIQRIPVMTTSPVERNLMSRV